MATDPLAPQDLKLTFDGVEFEVDNDGDLCIEQTENYGSMRIWLERAEGQKLLDLLTRWLK